MADVTVNSRLLGLKDVNVHVDDHGGLGRPVVLIHGWPLSGESWNEQIEALKSAGYRVITYDRRGFGRSDKPPTGYDYNTLTDDLAGLLSELELTDVTLIGFSMGGGEVARYITNYGEDRIHSVVFAAAITPYLEKSDDNPEGPLTKEQAAKMTEGLTADPTGFYSTFVDQFYSPNADGNVMVSADQVRQAIKLAHQADHKAALAAMASFGTTDFRDDLINITVPTLVIHGDADGIVLFDGSANRTHEAIPQSELHVISGGPHGINVANVDEFNDALIQFLNK